MISELSPGGKPEKSRSFNEVARDLLTRVSSATVRGWLAEVADAECISLMDAAVLRAMARNAGIDAP